MCGDKNRTDESRRKTNSTKSVDCTSNERFPESDILTTLPETPPGFEKYTSEEDMKQHGN